MHIAQHKILISSVIQFDDELQHLRVGLREDLPSISSLQHALHACVTVLMKTHIHTHTYIYEINQPADLLCTGNENADGKYEGGTFTFLTARTASSSMHVERHIERRQAAIIQMHTHWNHN